MAEQTSQPLLKGIWSLFSDTACHVIFGLKLLPAFKVLFTLPSVIFFSSGILFSLYQEFKNHFPFPFLLYSLYINSPHICSFLHVFYIHFHTFLCDVVYHSIPAILGTNFLFEFMGPDNKDFFNMLHHPMELLETDFILILLNLLFPFPL